VGGGSEEVKNRGFTNRLGGLHGVLKEPALPVKKKKSTDEKKKAEGSGARVEKESDPTRKIREGNLF